MMAAKRLTVLHFNDVYNIEPGQRDPVGGAARMQTKVKSLAHLQPLLLFGGDALNPSMMSTLTKGRQMVPVLNALGVQAACMGNHDFDHGTENLVRLARECTFPWLMANVLDRRTGEPYAQAKATHVIEWAGVKIGLVGLVEEERLATLGAVDPRETQYVDFVATGRRLATQLRAEQQCEVVIALTHMREPNDRLLCARAPEFDLVLGGHDHHYVVEHVQPHGTLLVKSGTDFQDLTQISVTINSRGAEGAASSVATTWERHTINSALPEDEQMAEIVRQYMELMGTKLDEVRGTALVDLDGRFKTVRTRESNLGNLVVDVWRVALGAEIAILNSGTLRSDQIHPAGEIKSRDIMAILPAVDESVVLQLTGQQVLEALENGVSQYPKLEGRFPQVSGIRFSFDPRLPPGRRVLRDSVTVGGGAALWPTCRYRVATKSYLAKGKDGYDVFRQGKVLVDAESCLQLNTSLCNHFTYLDILNRWDPLVAASKAFHTWKARALTHGRGSGQDVSGELELAQADHDSRYTLRAAFCKCALEGTSAHHPHTGRYGVAPRLDGRINNVTEVCCEVTWSSAGDGTFGLQLTGKDLAASA